MCPVPQDTVQLPLGPCRGKAPTPQGPGVNGQHPLTPGHPPAYSEKRWGGEGEDRAMVPRGWKEWSVYKGK